MSSPEQPVPGCQNWVYSLPPELQPEHGRGPGITIQLRHTAYAFPSATLIAHDLARALEQAVASIAILTATHPDIEAENRRIAEGN
jgi:hypothetical protein